MPTEVLVMCPACARPQPAAKACVLCGAALPDAPVPPAAPGPAAGASGTTGTRTGPGAGAPSRAYPDATAPTGAHAESGAKVTTGAHAEPVTPASTGARPGPGAQGPTGAHAEPGAQAISGAHGERGAQAAPGAHLFTGPPATTGAHPEPTELELGEGRRLVIGADVVELRGEEPPDRMALADVRRVRLEARRPIVRMLTACAPLLVGIALVDWWPLRGVLVVLLALTLWLYLRRRTWVLRIERENAAPRRIPLGGGSPGSGRGVTAQSRWLELAEELRRRGVDVDVER